ncbi:hypothetical protein B0T10DRAFT_497374, partial [Thelonectria olida]
YLAKQSTHLDGISVPVRNSLRANTAQPIPRITLFLHEDDNDHDLRSSIQEQFEALNEEILLFTRNLKKIDIKIYDGTGNLSLSTTYSTTSSFLRDRVTTEKMTRRNFHITRHVATKLPKNENREYTDAELDSAAYARSEIVLAFPLSEDSVPILNPQWVFAFMPVRRMGFKFVVQADFVTSANRQDIETTSIRNKSLADGIADAFIKGILQLCNHKTLQYVWMRYLPSHNDSYPWDAFWSRVIDRITSQLKSSPVLRPASLGPLKPIEELRRHTAKQLDQDGNPLFADISPERYISPGYEEADLDNLSDLGLEFTYMDELIKRVRADLDDESSRMRTISDSSWHSRAATLLQRPFEKKWDARIRELKQLKLLPLNNGTWTWAESGRVYCPTVHRLEIPKGLDLPVIDPQAYKNSRRKKLFELLGVKEADLITVCAAISLRHSLSSSKRFDPSISFSHARFLYNAHHFLDHRKPYLMRLVTQSGKYCDSNLQDVYLPSNDPLGAVKLLGSKAPGSGSKDGAPGIHVIILHDIYIQDVPIKPVRETLTWFDWLHDVLHVRRNFRLVSADGESLSDVCKYVAKHRPEHFMSLLLSTWDTEGPQIARSRSCREELLGTEVLCHSGLTWEMREVEFPTAQLKEIVARFFSDKYFFPWLASEHPFDQLSYMPTWEKISRDVGFGLAKTDLEFVVSLLDWISRRDAAGSDPGLREGVYKLYFFLEAKIRESANVAAAREQVRKRQAKIRYIHDDAWCDPKECVWGRPPVTMTTKQDLELLYSQRFSQLEHDHSHLSSFFQETLGVRMWTWEDVLDEIRAIASTSSQDSEVFDTIIALYKCLDDISLGDSDIPKLRRIFNSEKLICSFAYDPPTWNTLSNCIWSSATRIPGKTILNNGHDFDKLESFFLKTLGLYDKLKDQKGNMSVEEVRQDLIEFSARLSSEGKQMDPVPVRMNAIFPVRFPGRGPQLVTGSSAFVIADRSTLAADFEGRVGFLDFPLDQLRRIQNFVEWIGLEGRYLSRAVKEIFSADRETTRPISQPDREIRGRAHALLRIAVAFGSPEAVDSEEAFYSLLRNCETFETGRITTQLSLPGLPQEGPPINPYRLTNTSDVLKVFVPRRKKDREACFYSKLPQHLFAWMMSYPRTPLSTHGIKVVQAVLTASSYAVAGILGEAGIPPVSIPCEEEEEEEAESDEEETVYNDEGEPSEVVPSEPQRDGLSITQVDRSSGAELISHRDLDNATGNETENDATIQSVSLDSPPSELDDPDDVVFVARQSAPLRARPRSEPLARVSRPDARAPQSTPTQQRDVTASPERTPVPDHLTRPSWEILPSRPVIGSLEESNYLGLLGRVIAAARQSRIPSRGAFDMSGVQEALGEFSGEYLNPDSPFILRSTDRIERDKRIGAAGELFIFELLSHLSPELPGFGRNNWKSTIRSYVTGHPDYNDMSPWNGRETADITYQDVSGALTSLLADAGHMDTWDADRVRQARPEFFIEVKSTTGPFETPFYMSKAQYRRMQGYSQSRAGAAASFDRVYVIFRVYNVGQDSIGVKVLVDPESMRGRELAFTAETWSIVPAASRT